MNAATAPESRGVGLRLFDGGGVAGELGLLVPTPGHWRCQWGPLDDPPASRPPGAFEVPPLGIWACYTLTGPCGGASCPEPGCPAARPHP
jgi:hypothetical protein